MSSNAKIDLDIALRKIHELAMDGGDLGYEYWHEVGRLLCLGESMQIELNMLRIKLELCRKRLAGAKGG